MAENDNLLELHRQLRTSQDKYNYFILAAAASAIALVVNQTQDRTLEWTMVPLGLAVLCWGVSFYFGCRHLLYVNSIIMANYDLVKVQRGIHPLSGTDPGLISAASAGIKEAIESNNEKSNRLANYQFSLLISGAILFLVWHIIEMALRTIK